MNKRDAVYMSRCLALAAKAYRWVAPNPMVGAVVVYNDRIIGEGFHQQHGAPHAEPMAIQSVQDESLLRHSTLYVNLEPCSHYGKTPPCAELLVEKGIKRVVIAALDPNPKVAGKGVAILEQTGIEVIIGVLEAEARQLNRRFYTYFEKHRPHITIKWAQTADGFIDYNRTVGETNALRISSPLTQQLAHKMRAENMGILVSTNTVLLDNPSLSLRFWSGNNPIRIALDKNGRVTDHHIIKNQKTATYILTQKEEIDKENLQYISIEDEFYNVSAIINKLYQLKVQSVLIEGGATFLNSIIRAGIWDEANVEIAAFTIGNGVKAPSLDHCILTSESNYDNQRWIQYLNTEV